MDRKVLITGGAGFLGAHLANMLAEQGAEVDLVDNFSRGVEDGFLIALRERPNVRSLTLDLLDPGSLDALDADYTEIFHLAAIIGVRHVLERPYEVLRDNVRLTDHAIALAHRQKALRRFLFASTSEVTAGALQHYGLSVPTPEDTPLTLTDLAHPRTSYMLSKIYGEAMCRHAELPVTIFRPHNVYGPRMGMSHVVPELLKRALDAPTGGSLEVASVEHSRAFCFVDDAVETLARLATVSEALGGVFNIGNEGTEITIGTLAETILKTTGRTDLTIRPLPPTAGSPARRCPDMSRSVAVTGFAPKVSVSDGVRRSYEWYAAHVFSGQERTAV